MSELPLGILASSGAGQQQAVGLNDFSFIENEQGGVNNTILNMALQSDGKIIIAGLFTSVQGVSRNRIARLNTDGTLDTSFNVGTGFNYAPSSVSIAPDGSIWVAMGDPFTYNNINGRYFARISPTGELIPVSVTHPTEASEVASYTSGTLYKSTTEVQALPTGNIVYSMYFEIEEEDG